MDRILCQVVNQSHNNSIGLAFEKAGERRLTQVGYLRVLGEVELADQDIPNTCILRKSPVDRTEADLDNCSNCPKNPSANIETDTAIQEQQ